MTLQEPPLVSVIMPIRNEADYIEQSIAAVTRLDYPPDRFEILVVDGMSDDGTREIVTRMSANDTRIRLLDNPSRGVGPAMNIGIRASRGTLFTRVDGHALVEPDFLRESVRSLQEHEGAWVAGGIIETVAEGWKGKAIAAAMRSPIGVGNSRFRTGGAEGWVDTLAFGTHHRWVVDRVGHFDEELVRNQDDEFNLRIRQAGGRIWLSPKIKSTYFSRSSLRKLWRQYFQYGFWRIRTLQKHGRPGALRQLIPMAFVSGVVGLAAGSLVWSPFLRVLAAILAAYALILLVGGMQVGRNETWNSALLAPLVFAILHISYGFGCLWGVVRFVLLGGAGLPAGAEHRMSR